MDHLFSDLSLAEVHCDLMRNIVSLRTSQDLFDDLSDSPDEWRLAQHVESEVKPLPYRSNTPIIHRPFEDAEWFNAITYPFTHWQISRFSPGTFGVWYGSTLAETTVYETAYHWYHGLLRDAGFENESVMSERKLYAVFCDAALLDFRLLTKKHVELVHKHDYTATHAIGARIHREGHPGLITHSARHKFGENCVVFNPRVLSNPRYQYALTYRLEGNRITVEKNAGEVWITLPVD